MAPVICKLNRHRLPDLVKILMSILYPWHESKTSLLYLCSIVTIAWFDSRYLSCSCFGVNVFLCKSFLEILENVFQVFTIKNLVLSSEFLCKIVNLIDRHLFWWLDSHVLPHIKMSLVWLTMVVFCLDGFAFCLNNTLVGSYVVSHPSFPYMELLLSFVQYFRCVLSYAICFAPRVYFLTPIFM